MTNVSNKCCRENQNTHILRSVTFFSPRNLSRLWDNVEKFGGAREAADNMAHERYKLNEYGYRREITRRCQFTRTHARIKVHTHRSIKYLFIFQSKNGLVNAFPCSVTRTLSVRLSSMFVDYIELYTTAGRAEFHGR
jgi:hypothetical protein